MSRSVNIGLTSDYFKDGAFVVPGAGLKSLDEIPNVKYAVLPADREAGSRPFDTSDIRPHQAAGYDMIASIGPHWSAASFAGNDTTLSVHRHGAGYDMVSVSDLTAANVMLCTTPDAVKRPMAVVILTFLLVLSTRFQIKNKLARENRWSEISRYPGLGLVGKTLGVIGLGRIGQETFRLARPLDMRHIAFDPLVEPQTALDLGVELVDLATVLSESDYLSISCPLTNDTRHLIGAKQLAAMKSGAFLINAARGPIVDEPALADALQRGVIQGAALDVFESEPPSPDSPLLAMDSVVVTPHSLGWTDQAVGGIWSQIVNQMTQIMNGAKPTGLINDAVWEKPEFQAKLKRFLSEIG